MTEGACNGNGSTKVAEPLYVHPLASFKVNVYVPSHKLDSVKLFPKPFQFITNGPTPPTGVTLIEPLQLSTHNGLFTVTFGFGRFGVGVTKIVSGPKFRPPTFHADHPALQVGYTGTQV